MLCFEEIFILILLALGVFYFLTCAVSFAGLFRQHPPVTTLAPFVSVITAARNEEDSIGDLIGDLVAQDYPSDRCEFIMVDDCSSDRTAEIIDYHASLDGRVRHASTACSTSPFTHKKRAVHEGIMVARGEIIMTVDADCRVPLGWIKGMVSRFSTGIDLVAGEVSIRDGGIVADMETLEFFGIQSVSAGLAGIGFPVTCNGANLAYRRSAFDAVGGFDDIGHLVSGDDDLVMQKIARGNPSGIVYAIDAGLAVKVDPVPNIREFLTKRTRWVSKILSYPSKKAVIFLSAIFLFLASVPVYAICTVAGFLDPWPLAVVLLLKITGDLLPVTHGLMRHGKMRCLRSFLLAECLHIPYIIIISFKGVFGTFDWHGRRSGASNRKGDMFETHV